MVAIVLLVWKIAHGGLISTLNAMAPWILVMLLCVPIDEIVARHEEMACKREEGDVIVPSYQ